MTRQEHRRGSWWVIGLGMVLIMWGSMPRYAEAMHKVEHRFTVYGSVRDGSSFPGKPVAGQEVVVRDAQTQTVLNRGVTDQHGRFAIRIHVHNTDLGKPITIQTQTSQETLTLRFDPNDTTTERRARVDLVVFPGSR